MTSELRVALSRPRLIGFLSIAAAAFLIGMLLSLPATADPVAQETTRGTLRGSLRLSIAGERLAGAEPIRVPLSPGQWTTILSEDFEGTWPTGNWVVGDNDVPPELNGEYYWANRCSGYNSALSAWGIGGGANGSGLSCGASYPNLANSWMIYGPVDLSQATAAELSFNFWLNSQCDGGPQCSTAADPLWALVSTDGQHFDGTGWAGNWYQDPSADPNGWVAMTLDMNSLGTVVTGQSQVWIAFVYQSDDTIVYPGGAYVDDVVVRAITGTTPTPTSTTVVPLCPNAGAVDVVFAMDTSGSMDDEFSALCGQISDVISRLQSQGVTVNYRILGITQTKDCAQDTVSNVVPGGLVNHYEDWGPAVVDLANEYPWQAGYTRLIIPMSDEGPEDGEPEEDPGPDRDIINTAIADAVANQVIVSPVQGTAAGSSGDPVKVERLMRDLANGTGGRYFQSSDPAQDLADGIASLIGTAACTPVIDTVSPECDVTAQTLLTITGANFLPGATVTIGGLPARDVTRVSANEIRCRIDPSLPNGTYDVTVTNPPGGWSYTKHSAVTVGPCGGITPTSTPTATATVCPPTAFIRSVTPNRTCYEPGVQAGILVDVGTSLSSQSVRVEVSIVTADIIWASAETTFTAPGQQLLLLQVPSYLTADDYTLVTMLWDANTNCYQGAHEQTIRIDPQCGVITPVITDTPTRTPTATGTPTPTRTATRTPTRTPTATVTQCPPARPPVTPSCSPGQGPNYVRNPEFEKFNRSWGEYSNIGREIVSSDGALDGFYSAHFEGPSGQANHELLYQLLDIPPDVTAASFWVDQVSAYASGWGFGEPPPPPANGMNYFRVSIYDLSLTTELARLWQFDLALSPECEKDPPFYNLSPTELNRVRGNTIALVFEFRKVTTAGNWRAGVVVDDIHFHVCSPSPPCRVERDKTANPSTVLPGGEVTVMLSLAGLDGACLPYRKPADVMLVLDRSGSMDDDTQPGGPPQPITDAKNAAKAFVDRMDLSMDQVGLVSFSDAASLDQTLTQMAGPVRTAIDGLVASGSTNIADALSTAQGELTSGRHRASNQPVLILLSDGQPTAGGDPRPAASAAKAAGTRIFTIGLGTGVDPNLMRDLASSSADYFYAPDSSQLDAIYQQIAGAIAGSPATNITIVDRLSQYVTLVPNSFTGSPVPTVSADGRTLTWRIPRLGLETRVWSYRVKMTQTPGTWPTNDSATATYTNSQGQPASLIFPIPQVTVLPPAEKHPQIMCRDHTRDDGSVPSNPNGEAWWDSPDIWVRNQQDGGLVHQNPIAGQTNYIYVRVRNTGDAAVDNITVHVYDAKGAANLRWPDDWVPEIGTATIASLPAGQTAVVSVPWTPAVQGHYCFLTRIEALDDTITFDGWVPFDNNICQRNVQIIESGSSSTGVEVGNRNRGSFHGSLTINSKNFPSRGTGTLTFNDPGLFQRWQQAGGTVSGGQVMTGTHSVQFNLKQLRSTGSAGEGAANQDDLAEVEVLIERIPFEGEEVSSMTFEVTGPAGSEAPTLEITEWVDDQAVGGNVLRAEIPIKVYLPVILKNRK